MVYQCIIPSGSINGCFGNVWEIIALDLLAVCLLSFGENSTKRFTFFAANIRLLYFEKYSSFSEFRSSVSESSIACLSFCFALIKSSRKC